jgi:hypothetical protein
MTDYISKNSVLPIHKPKGYIILLRCYGIFRFEKLREISKLILKVNVNEIVAMLKVDNYQKVYKNLVECFGESIENFSKSDLVEAMCQSVLPLKKDGKI